MSADLLREAAAELRAVVGKLTTDTARWDEAFPTRPVYGDHHTYERVFVHPAAILATADWLDDAARYAPHDDGERTQRALAVARAYLGRPA